MKKIGIFFLFLIFLIPNVKAEELEISAKSGILMSYDTGDILYKKNESEKLAPASMTKIMSLILIMDQVENGNLKLDEKVEISQNASSMGGSQIFLQPNTKEKVDDLIKAITVASANDAVVALAEKIAGSEKAFVNLMNKKAQELGCKNTHFENVHGLDSDNHYSTAYDMALMAKELIRHEKILNYSKIYEEYFTKSDGTKIWLVNTNKLVRFDKSVDGLKTGYTQKAGYCLTATAKKNNMRLISVLMNEADSKTRTKDTQSLLTYGFNSYKIQKILKKNKKVGKIKINRGKEKTADLIVNTDISKLIKISDSNKKYKLDIKKYNVTAPIKVGEKVGELKIIDEDGNIYKKVPLTINKNIERNSYFDVLLTSLKQLIGGNV